MQIKHHMHGQTRRIVIDAQSDEEMAQIADALSTVAPEGNVGYDLLEFANGLQTHVGKKLARRKQDA